MFSCQYCEEFESGKLEINGQDLGNRIIFESDNFVVVPSLGQIVEGYLLIISKKHYTSIGEIPPGLHDELDTVCQKVRKILFDSYGMPLFFEHGPSCKRQKGGSCIDHAHLHVVPVQIDILPELSKHFRYKIIKSFDALKKQFDKGVSYFFYESNLRERYLFEVSEIVPSQYIRQIIASKIGKPERWDWRSCFGINELLKTIERLKNKF